MPIDITEQPDSPEKRAAIRREYRRARDLAASTRASGRDEPTVNRWAEQAASWRDQYMGMNGCSLDHTNPRYQQILAELEGND